MPPRDQRMAAMLLSGLGLDKRGATFESALETLWPHEAVRQELCELFLALSERSTLLRTRSTKGAISR